VKDAIAVALEAGSVLVRLFFARATPRANASRGTGNHQRVQTLFTLSKWSRERYVARDERTNGGPGVVVSNGDRVVGAFIATHGRGPTPRAF